MLHRTTCFSPFFRPSSGCTLMTK